MITLGDYIHILAFGVAKGPVVGRGQDCKAKGHKEEGEGPIGRVYNTSFTGALRRLSMCEE